MWMIRIAQGVFPDDVKEKDFLSSRGRYSPGKEDLTPTFRDSLMYKLSYNEFGSKYKIRNQKGEVYGYDQVRRVEIGDKNFKLKYFEEVYTTSKGLVRLYRLKYGKYPVKRVEEVQFNDEKVCPAEETRSTGVSESSLELGPQHLLHLKIILSNSNLCYAQVISLPIIFFILAWASHREEAEQELAIMVPMLFLPWLLLVALHTIMIWRNVALILGAGLLLPSYIFFVVVAYKF